MLFIRKSTKGAPTDAADPKSICDFEVQHDVSLPADYVDFMLSSGGGTPEPGWIKLPKKASYALRTKYLPCDYIRLFPRLIPPFRPSFAPSEIIVTKLPRNLTAIAVADSGEDAIVLNVTPSQSWISIALSHYEDGELSEHVLFPTFSALIRSFSYPRDTKPWLECIALDDVKRFREWHRLIPRGKKVESDYAGTPLEQAILYQRRDILDILISKANVNEAIDIAIAYRLKSMASYIKNLK